MKKVFFITGVVVLLVFASILFSCDNFGVAYIAIDNRFDNTLSGVEYNGVGLGSDVVMTPRKDGGGDYTLIIEPNFTGLHKIVFIDDATNQYMITIDEIYTERFGKTNYTISPSRSTLYFVP